MGGQQTVDDTALPCRPRLPSCKYCVKGIMSVVGTERGSVEAER